MCLEIITLACELRTNLTDISAFLIIALWKNPNLATPNFSKRESKLNKIYHQIFLYASFMSEVMYPSFQ